MEELIVYGPLISRKQAKEQGLTQYFSGSICKHGHLAVRQTSKGVCIECHKIYQEDRQERGEIRAYYARRLAADPVGLRAQKAKHARDSYQRHKDDPGQEQKRKQWYQDNKDKDWYKKSTKKAMKKFVETGKKAESDRRYSKTEAGQISRDKARDNWIKNNPELHLICKRERTRIKHLIDSGFAPKGTSFSKTIGCIGRELVTHIESQFNDGMSWENRNLWHIDHVRPCTEFDLFDKEQHKVCFNYRNLQPLWAEDNLAKLDNYTPLDELAWVERMQALGYEGELFLKYEEGNSY